MAFKAISSGHSDSPPVMVSTDLNPSREADTGLPSRQVVPVPTSGHPGSNRRKATADSSGSLPADGVNGCADIRGPIWLVRAGGVSGGRPTYGRGDGGIRIGCLGIRVLVGCAGVLDGGGRSQPG